MQNITLGVTIAATANKKLSLNLNFFLNLILKNFAVNSWNPTDLY
jgi:hypothetical protein